VHYGETCFSGHYTCFVRHQGQWHLFDDEKVTRNVSPAVVLKQNAYILFYKKNKPNSRTSSVSTAPLNKSNEHVSAAPVIAQGKKKNKRKGNATVNDTCEQKTSVNASSEVLASAGDTAKSPRASVRPKCRAYYRTKEDDSIEDLIIKLQLSDLVR